MAKKHCNKHKRFVYNCPDCQEAARKFASEGAEKKEEEIKPIRPHVDIDLKDEKKEEERYRYVHIQDKKYKIKTNKIKKYLLILAPVILVIITIIILFIIWPIWHGGIDLQAQLYRTKAGGLDYYNFYFLNFWSTNFFFNKTALFAAILGCIIMSIPPNRNLLTIIGTRLRFGKPSMKKALIFWWTIGFIIFYFMGLILGSISDFAWTIYLIENGEIQFSLTTMTDAFITLFDASSMNLEAIFVYNGIFLPIIVYIIIIFIARAVFNIASNYYLKRNDYNILANGFMVAGLFCGIIFFSMPTFALNGIELIQIWALPIFFISFITLGLLSYASGKSKLSKNKRNFKILIPEAKKIGLTCVFIVLIALMPIFISIGPSLSLNNVSIWTDLQWNRHDYRTIKWTQVCAGLDIFEERAIENFTTSPITNDTQIISRIRQYDQEYAVPNLAAEMGSTYESLADSDIVYINGSEYWVAPKTLKVEDISGDAIQTNTELYDHVEGFLALDTFSGQIVNITDTFNISEHYPIFFGEHERTYSSGAYDSDILLDTGWAEGIENNKYVYEGEPDGTLVGLEAFWYSVQLGLLSYATNPSAQYLINRNIKTRVERILLPQLKVDYDPYLVFDRANGKIYYAVSIYTSINIGSYSKTPIYRFLGISLIDVINGEMSFYKNPSLVESKADPTYNLWKIFMTKYNWKTVPTWLFNQIRYPESLFELQLEAYYRYHVSDPTTWKRGDDFHERPEDGDLFYIETDLGEGIEYVGLDLVEYYGQEARTLAGMYVIRHGDHFGEAIFYHTRDSSEKLIGPKTARDSYAAEATDDIFTITNYRHGNTLLYPLGDSIYYYVPTYSDVSSIQNLELTGFVEAFTREVGYGDDVMTAYNNLGISGSEPNISTLIDYEFVMESEMTYPDDLAYFHFNINNTNTNSSAPGYQVVVNLTLWRSEWENYSLVNYPLVYPISYNNLSNGITFTLLNTTLKASDGYGGHVYCEEPNIIFFYRWEVFVEDLLLYSEEGQIDTGPFP